MNDARYTIVVLDETAAEFPLVGSVTVGRHLDNDVVIAGEDVRDFHVRIETSDRGPRAVVLDGATAHRNTVPIDGPIGMRPGDELVLGHHRLRIDVATTAPRYNWKLHRMGDGLGVPLPDHLRIGRATDCGLQLVDGHLSRHHAEIVVIEGTIWLEDLNSANGTFVNGDRVIGARRLFHGDEVAFDTIRYQLIGDAPDLTPIRPPGQPPDQLGDDDAELLQAERAPAPADATENPTLTPLTTPVIPMPTAEASAPMLLGRSAPIAGRVFPLGFGRHVIGRGADAEIYVPEASVSLRHAEVELRPDGAQVVNLISTNGTLINGAPIHAARLHHGDSIRVGRVTLEYREAGASRADTPRARLAWIVAAGVGALLLLLLVWVLAQGNLG